MSALIAILYVWFQFIAPAAARPCMLDEPLGLTVHSLPPPQEALAGDGRAHAHGPLKMLVVLAVCAAPVVASYFTYYVVRPEGRRNYGELVEPQRPVARAHRRQRWTASRCRCARCSGQWLLVSVAGGACDAACENHLYLQRQLRESLGKDKDRLDWVWLVADGAPVARSLQPALAQATVLRVDGAQLAPVAGAGAGPCSWPITCTWSIRWATG